MILLPREFPLSEERLHAVRHLDLPVEHVPQQRGQQVLRVKQGDEHPRQLVHLVGGDHVGQRDGYRQLS